MGTIANSVAGKPTFIRDGLVLFYEGRNPNSLPTTGTAITDLSSSAANGTLQNGSAYSASNYGVISLDGTNDYISTNANFNLQRDWTLEVWFLSDNDTRRLFGQTVSIANNTALHIVETAATHGIRFGMYNNDIDAYGSGYENGVYYQMVFTYRNSSPWEKRIYKNAVRLTTQNIGAGPAQYGGSGVLNIGTIYTGPPGGFGTLDGNIALVRAYNRVLTDAEILRNFNADRNYFGATLGTVNSYAGSGLIGARYNGYFNDDVNWFNTASVTSGPSVYSSITGAHGGGDFFSLQWTGYFIPNATGTWTFYTASDDASYLWIGSTASSGWSTGNALVNNGGLHGTIEKSGSISLTKNQIYPIRIQFGENGGGEAMDVNVAGPTVAKTTSIGQFCVYNLSGTAPNYGL